ILMPTIRSRCQPLSMPRPDTAQALQWLQAQSPAHSPEQCQAALKISGNRPLAALAALEADLPAQRLAFLEDLGRVPKKQLLPIELARTHEKSNRQELLMLMQQCLASLIRYQASGLPRYLGDSALRGIAESGGIDQGAGGGQGRRLHQLYDTIREGIAQLSSPSNPNPSLILETCLIRWQQELSASN